MKEKSPEAELSEQDRLLLQSLLDGELSLSDRAALESRIASGDEAMAKELAALREVRRYVQTWHQQEVVEVIKDRSPVWSRIESQIREEASRKRVQGAQSLGFDIRRLVDFFRRPQAVGGFAAALAVAMLFFARDSRTGNTTTQSTDRLARAGHGLPGESETTFASLDRTAELANSAPLQLSEAASAEQQDRLSGAPQAPFFVAGNTVDEDLLTKVGIGSLGDHADYSLAGPLVQGGMSSRPLSGTLASRLLSSPQLIVPNDIPGGLRAGGADIDWIKTAKPFKFVPSKDHSNPPVVWIARATSHP
ncbi:MAG: hypothetical protein U0136_12600 [Bdellovibrionota bacterium]